MIDVFDFLQFAPNFLKISDKQGAIVPFQLNRAQLYVHEQIEAQKNRLGYVRALVLKGRQQGISTYIQGRYFHKTITIPGTSTFILAHMSMATQSLFDITKRSYTLLPGGLAPKATKASADELEFDTINSRFRVGTAGSKEIGRSTTNQLLHLSEYAFYKNAVEIKRSIEQTVSDLPGTEKIKESTANGIDNAFYKDWTDAKKGESDWIAIFVPWYWQPEYTRNAENMILTSEEKDWLKLYGDNGLTIEHLAWRRQKLSDFDGDIDQKKKGFAQEYPFTDEEAFLNSITNTFISIECVEKARNTQVDSDSPLVLGIDVARHGDDYSAITYRCGRKVLACDKYKGLNTMELAGIVADIIDRKQPVKVFIDSIGIGAGVVDRLIEMGYSQVDGVNSGRTANLKEKFANRRAEMWWTARDWLTQEMDVEIPDDPELQAQLCGLGYLYRTNGQLLIESKIDAKKRGMDSPDKADSFVLTFADGMNPGSSFYEPQRRPHGFGDMLS